MFEQYRGLRKENYILAFGRLVTGLGSMIWPMMTLILSQKMGVSAKGVSVLLAAAMVGMAPAIYQLGYVYLIPLDLAEIQGESGALIYGSVTSVNCVVVVLFTPVITRLFGSRSEPSRLTAGAATIAASCVLMVRDRIEYPNLYQD